MSNNTIGKYPKDGLKKRTKDALDVIEGKPGLKRQVKKLGLTTDSIACIVAVALIGKETHNQIIIRSAKAKKQEKAARNNLQTKIKEIEDIFDKPFYYPLDPLKSDLDNGKITTDYVIALKNELEKKDHPMASELDRILSGQPPGEQIVREIKDSSRMETFFNQHKARPYLKAAIEKTLADEKKVLEVGKTRPKQNYFDRYCSAFRALFARSGKSPNSKLIADIANLFNLTDNPQTSETIRTRIQRLTWKSPYSK